MKKIMYLIIAVTVLIFYSCSKNDFGNAVQPACVTSPVPQQIQLDWSYFEPSYFEIDPTTNAQVPCTEAPFYDASSAELNNPPFATNYNYTTQASAIPIAGLVPSPSVPNGTITTSGKVNEIAIPQSASNYLCQITVQSMESGQDNCTYNGLSGTGPVGTWGWSTPGATGSVPMYEFTSLAADPQNLGVLNNQVIIDYFDVYSLCSTVTERPYFIGVAQIPVPDGVAANTQLLTIRMYDATPVLQ